MSYFSIMKLTLSIITHHRTQNKWVMHITGLLSFATNLLFQSTVEWSQASLCNLQTSIRPGAILIQQRLFFSPISHISMHQNCLKLVQNIHLHFSVIEQHAIHFLNGSFGCLLSLKMHKAVAFRAILVTNHLRERRHVLLFSQTHTHTHKHAVTVYSTWPWNIRLFS